MPYNDPFFPSTVWDGLTFNRNRIDLNSNQNPNSDDWERIAAEVMALEQYVTDNPPVGGQVDVVVGGTDITVDSSDPANPIVNYTGSGGGGSTVSTITAASTSLDLTIDYILADCSSNTVTLNLPLASTQSGAQINIKKIDGSANTVVIDGSGAETIDDELTHIINTQYESVNLVSDGTNWYIF